MFTMAVTFSIGNYPTIFSDLLNNFNINERKTRNKTYVQHLSLDKKKANDSFMCILPD